MHCYFSRPEELPKIGRQTYGADLRQHMADVLPGEILVAHCQRGLFDQAIWVNTSEVMQFLQGQAHAIHTLTFYAVHGSKIRQLGLTPRPVVQYLEELGLAA